MHVGSVTQSCRTFWDSCSPPNSSVHGIFQARILEWVSISYSRGSSWPRIWTCVSCASCTDRILYHWATWEALASVCALPTQSLPSLPALCDPMDCSWPGSLSMGFSRQEYWSGCQALLQGIFPPRDRTCVSCIAGGFFPTEPVGKPLLNAYLSI